jgi:hypothetical protein
MEKNKKGKPKIVNRSKEQIVMDAERDRMMKEIKEKVKEQRIFVKDVFYPFLLENSKDVKDTLRSLKMIIGEISTKFQEDMIKKQKELSECLLKDFNVKDRKYFSDNLVNTEYERDCKILDLFADYKLNDATAMIEGMMNEIKMFLEKEYEGRGLNTVHAEFLIDEENEKGQK